MVKKPHLPFTKILANRQISPLQLTHLLSKKLYSEQQKMKLPTEERLPEQSKKISLKTITRAQKKSVLMKNKL